MGEDEGGGAVGRGFTRLGRGLSASGMTPRPAGFCNLQLPL